MASAVEKIEGPVSQLPVQSESAAVLGLIERASRDPSVDIAKLEKLMEWRDKTVSDQRRAAFEHELAAAKAAIPVIAKNATGHNSKRYVDFAGIAKTIDPILGSHGLSYRFRTVQTDKISVTCILFGHGHSEETTLSAPPDGSGNKNAIQAIGSTLTYLQRYSLVQMLGLAASDDDDGNAGGAVNVGAISAEQAAEIRRLLTANSKDESRFLRWAKAETIEAIRADYYQSCVDTITAKAAK